MDIINQINTLAYPIAIPIFILLILVEIYLGWRDRNQNHELKDSSVNIASGLVFFAISLITKSLKLALFFYVYDNF